VSIDHGGPCTKNLVAGVKEDKSQARTSVDIHATVSQCSAEPFDH